MQQGDLTASYYQYYQSYFQHSDPNPTSNSSDLQASAPPFSSDYQSYSSPYSSYSQYSDNVSGHPPTAPTCPPNPNFQPSELSSQSSFSNHFQPYDQNQTSHSYDPPYPVHNSNMNSLFPGNSYSTSAGQASTLMPPNHEGGMKLDGRGGYFDESGSHAGFRSDGYGGGVYAYDGSKMEPYGGRGSGPEPSMKTAFDDYGRPISLLNANVEVGSRPVNKIVKATPKIEVQNDTKSGVQKFRVKLLAEAGGQSNTDVLCQIGLDGIRMLDPASGRTLRIYPLEMLTKWEVLDSFIFAFWAKSSIDIEPRCIRLQSNNYTVNIILDTLTAASVQLNEMDARNNSSDSFKVSEQYADRKRGFSDWINMMKSSNEEKDHWVPDEAVTECTACCIDFGPFVRKHHCRNCGDIFCDKCTQGRIALTAEEGAQPVRVCDQCMAEVTQRLSSTSEAAHRISGLQSHEDLAKKLQEEMNRKCKTSSGLKSDGSGMQMREVACPTCTVHLQVQVPTSGSETIECSVCQHPFRVTA